MLFAHPCKQQMLLGNIVTWQIQPMGDLLKYNGFFNTTRYYDYNKACLKLKYEKILSVFCKPPGIRPPTMSLFKPILIGALCFTSGIFFFITLLVYTSLPFLRNLHGKTLMCHVFSLGMGFFTMGNIKLNPLLAPEMTYTSYYLRRTLGTI